MAKYLLIWDLNPQHISEDPATRANHWKQMMQMIDSDFEKGVLLDWGAFIGEQSGYCVVEGSELDISLMTQQYVPYVAFETHPCSTAEQTKELLNAMTGG